MKILMFIFCLLNLLVSSTAFADPNDDLIKGIASANLEQVKKAINEGADVNYKDEDGAPAILHAMSSDFLILKTLIQAGANADVSAPTTGVTPLHWAARWGYTESFWALFYAGANPQAKDKDGYSVLDYAKCDTVASEAMVRLAIAQRKSNRNAAILNTGLFLNDLIARKKKECGQGFTDLLGNQGTELTKIVLEYFGNK